MPHGVVPLVREMAIRRKSQTFVANNVNILHANVLRTAEIKHRDVMQPVLSVAAAAEAALTVKLHLIVRPDQRTRFLSVSAGIASINVFKERDRMKSDKGTAFILPLNTFIIGRDKPST
jgi:hypothetical protein